MAFHLTKCKAAYEELHPDVPLRECDFNVTHKVPDPELQVICFIFILASFNWTILVFKGVIHVMKLSQKLFPVTRFIF